MATGNMEADIQTAIDEGKLNGAILCISDAAGSFEYNKAFGERTLLSGEKRPQALDDVLSLASATKFMATIAALQCVEDGLLSLTGDLSKIAPELAAKQIVKGFSEDGEETPILEAQIQPITLEQLLTHSSGMVYHFIDPKIAKWRAKYGRAGAEDKKDEKDWSKLTVEETMDYPLGFQPGKGWMYSPALDWTGVLVERVTGKTLGEHINTRILGPVGHAGEAQFYPVTDPKLRERLVDLNPNDPHAVGRAVIAGADGAHHRRNKGAFGGHGMFTTAPAYAAVLRSLLANDGKVLRPETVDDMLKDHLSPESKAVHWAALEGPGGVFFRVGTAPGSKAGFGLGGLLTLEDADGMFGEGTLIWEGGHTFVWFFDRKNDLCAVGAFQAALPFNAPAIAALKKTFRREAYRIRKDSGAAKAA